MIYFVYGVIVIVVFLIAVINIQPFKKIAVRYPSTDTVFYILLSLVCTDLIVREVEETEKYSFSTITQIILFSTAFVPIVYIACLISFWMISRMRWIGSLF